MLGVSIRTTGPNAMKLVANPSSGQGLTMLASGVFAVLGKSTQKGVSCQNVGVKISSPQQETRELEGKYC